MRNIKTFVLGKRIYGIPLFLIIIISILLLGGVVFATAYNLNKTFNATVTITSPPEPPPPPPPPVEVTLYTDALATVPIPGDYIHEFGSYEEGATPQKPLWFRSSEIAPSSVVASATGLPGSASLLAMVGTPMNALPEKPCVLALALQDMPVGAYSFSITITGSGGD